MEKMRTEALGLRMKIQELRDERNDRQRLFDGAESENQAALKERDSTIADLRSLLDRRRRELDGLEQSVATTQDERTRLQLHSNEISMSLVTLRQELDEARAVATAARVSEEAGRQQLARMMDEQLAQTQTIEALRRQVETSNTAARDARALLRATQDQQQQYLRMPPPSNLPAATAGNIGNTPFVPAVSTPSTGLRTMELHGPGYHHVGSPADPGYAEQMRAMYGTAGREDIDSLRYDPPRQDPPRYDPSRQNRLQRDLQASGSSSQGSSSQSNQRAVWQSRQGQGIPAFPGSRIIPARVIDAREAAYRRTIQFASMKVPKLTKTTLVNTEVHLFIQYIHQLLRQEAFDESVMGNMIDTETISLLQFIFYPTETRRRHPITTHWTVDWDVATIIEALEELYPLQAEHRHLDMGSRWQQVIDRSNTRIRIQADNMAQVQRDTIQEWNSGATTIGPIPPSMNERVLKGLSQSFTHRDNPHGHGHSNIAFQRDLDELLEADAEYQDNPSLARLCYLVADLITGKVGNKK